MKSIELLATGLRLVGLYLIVVTVQSAAGQYQAIEQFSAIAQADVGTFVYFGIAEVLLLAFSAFVLIKFPVTIANWLVPNTKQGGADLGGSAIDIQTCLFCVLGVYILSWSVPDLFYNVLWLWLDLTQRNTLGAAFQFNEIIINLVVTIIEIAVGLYLTLQASGLSHLILRMRAAGSK